MLFRSVHIVARFYNSSNTTIPRFLYYPLISRRYSSVCLDSPSDSAQENENRSAIDSVVKIFSFYRGDNGGPVVMGKKVVGMAIKSRSFSENNYIITTPIINHFLSGDEETGQYIGLCSLNITYQSMEDAQIRVLINDVYPLSGAHGILKKEDVILAIDGVSIGNNGTGFVFVPLSKPFIDDSADMCECPTNEKARMSGEQIVIISKFLMNDTTKGYNHLKLSRVMKVNGVEVLNLRHLRQLVEECCAEQLSFDLENGNVIAVNCKSAQKKRLR
ncbi:unnamed protein product [Brassica rapa subsp. trilocularis]